MPDYIHIDDLEASISSMITKTLDGIAGARLPNHLILNPDFIEVDVIVLFEANAVETDTLQTPARQTETSTETPPIITRNSTRTTGESTQESTQQPPSRTVLTGRGGSDASDTYRTYGEYAD